MPRVLVVLYPGCTHGELSPALQLLSGHAEVRMVGPSEDPVLVSEGFHILVDGTFAEATLDDVALVLVPGGDPASVLDDLTLHALIARAAAETKVAAICNGVLLCAAAGIVSERRVTHMAVSPYASSPEFDELLELGAVLFGGSEYVDEDVVIDGPLITAKPWAAIRFAKLALVHAGLLSSDEAASRARYLHGFRDRSLGDPHQRWAIFLTEVAGTQASREDIEAHVEHLRVLERQGKLELAGPFPGRGSGLVVVRARDEAEARAIAARDPFVTRGVRAVEVRRWLLSSEDSNHLL